MNTPWLIQRAEIRPEPLTDRKGIDALLAFDYMGSAEYEFGALPKSLKRIRATLGEYDTFQHNIRADKTLTVFCKRAVAEDMPPLLDMLARGKVRLKEATEMDVWVYPETASYKSRNNFWWDIENDWMAWESNRQFRDRFLEAVKPVEATA